MARRRIAPLGNMAGGVERVAAVGFGLSPTPMLTRDEAVARIRRALTARPEIRCVELRISSGAVHRHGLFDMGGGQVAFPREGDARFDHCFVALIDPAPTAMWAHPAWWAFVPARGGPRNEAEPDVELVPTTLPEHPRGPVRLEPVTA